MSLPVNNEQTQQGLDLEDCFDNPSFNNNDKQLEPLMEDLADWLNKTLSIDHMTKENFFPELDNGVTLCHLAQLICEKVKLTRNEDSPEQVPVPVVRKKCFEKARRRSFFSRDNVENFIKFCKSFGVHENLLFESNDLVIHQQPRNVILCLLEVARIATRYGFDPPQLVKLEKEISEDELDNFTDFRLSSRLSWRFDKMPPKIKLKHSRSFSGASNESVSSLQSSETDSLERLNTDTVIGNGFIKKRVEFEANVDVTAPSSRPPSKLDRQVEHAIKLMQRNCNCSTGKCSKLSVRKVSEGKYNIAGRKVFVRLLNDCHMMVRVGGGWDTLDHFLSRHDPCQVRTVSRAGSSLSGSSSPESPNGQPNYLHIRAKYQSANASVVR